MASVTDTMLPEVMDTTQTRTATSIISVVWQRKSLVILGTVIGLVLGSLFYAQRQPIYQSVAKVHVHNRSAQSFGTGSEARAVFQYDYMSTQVQLLQSEDIALQAARGDKCVRRLQEEGFSSFPDAKKPEELVQGIMSNLTVTRDIKDSTTGGGGNNILLLSFRGTNREETKIILEALIDAYDKYIAEVYKNLNDNVVKDINRARDELEKKIQVADDEHSSYMKKCPILVTKIAGGMSAIQKEFNLSTDMLARVSWELKSKSIDLESLRKIYKDKGAESATKYMINAGYRLSLGLTGDPELDKQLTTLKINEKLLRSKYGDKHPEVVNNVTSQAEIRAILTKKTKPNDPSNFPEGAQNPEPVLDDPAAEFIKSLETDVESTGQRLHELEKNHRALQDDMKVLSEYDTKVDQLHENKMRARSLFSEVQKKVQEADFKRDTGFTARAINKPGIGFKISPNPYQVFTAATLLGLLLGVGLAYLAEISDKSFRNPQEIRKRLGLPVIGHVPYLAPDEKAAQLVATGASTLDPMLVTHYQSNSVGAEAYRGVRTALYFSTQGAGHQVIQVTSPNVSDGKSTLAANLAVSIAQSGKRTLLIDADFRKPRVHKIFNVPATVGMASVMAGQCDLGSAAQPTAVPNLSVMPCGPRPVNPAELLTSPKFKDLLEELRHQYDFVVVDTPPILVVTDPAVVAPRVDGVVLCIRVTKNGRPYAERAREVLASLGANVLGVVVNGFGAQVGGNRYGYEHYNYGYGEGYSYTYGYSYGYADKEAASYYGNTPDEVHVATPAGKS